jgi:hypothetical protein
VVAGEDVGHYGGSYKVTYDLYKKYGDMRVLDTPICGEFAPRALPLATWGMLTWGMMGPWAVHRMRRPGAGPAGSLHRPPDFVQPIFLHIDQQQARRQAGQKRYITRRPGGEGG